MGIFSSLLGGGGAEVDVDQLMEIMQMEQEMNRKNQYGLFGGWEQRQGEDGIWGQHQTINPALQGGLDDLMSRMGGGESEGYSSPSQLNQLLDARMANQFDRSGISQQNAPDPNQYGPSSSSQYGAPQQGPGQPMMPGQAQPQPGGPQPGPQGPQPGGGVGGLGDMFGPGQKGQARDMSMGGPGMGGGIGGMFGAGGGADGSMAPQAAEGAGMMQNMMAAKGRGRQPRPGFMQQIKGNYEPGQGAGTPMQNLSRALQGRPELEQEESGPSPFQNMMGMFR